MDRPQTLGGRVLRAALAVGLFVCIDFHDAGLRSAHAFDFQLKTETKEESSSEKTTLKGQASDSLGWLSVKFGGAIWDMNPSGIIPLTLYDLMSSKPVPMDLNQLQILKSTLADTHATVGMWDDWVVWTSRLAYSNYVKPNNNLEYLVRPIIRPGLGLDDIATSQHIDAGVWKTDSMRLSLFAEYDRVGANFEAPRFAIKIQDPFSTPNSTTMRLGGSFEWKPITFTLEQRTQQSLTDNAPTSVENQVGVAVSLDYLKTRSGLIPQGMSWLVPSSTYLTVGRGTVRAALDQGVNGDTFSEASAGLSWNVGNFYANVGYWMSNYQSQLYPWKGLGLNGSLGFYEGQWGVNLYFNVYRSSYAYPQWGDVLAGQQLIAQQYNDISGGFSLTRHF